MNRQALLDSKVNTEASKNSIKVNQKTVFEMALLGLKVACLLAFLIQMGLSFYKQTNPDKTVAKTTKTGLEEIDFPVVFKICMNPSFNETEAKSLGYTNTFNYFMGKSMFNDSIYGWAGHTEDGEVVSNALDIQNKIFLNHHSVINWTALWIRNEWTVIPRSSFKLLRPNFPNNCLTLDISTHMKSGDKVEFLYIVLDKSTFVTKIEVHVEDRLQTMSRYYMASKLKTQGPNIFMKDLQDCSMKTYMLKFTQNIYVEEDKDHNCVVYPTANYSTFESCDSQYLSDLLQQESLQPAWATPQDLSLATNLSTATAGPEMEKHMNVQTMFV